MDVEQPVESRAVDSVNDRLHRIEALTDATLAHLRVDDLLVELFDRVRDLLEVDTTAALVLDPSGSHLVPIVAVGLDQEIRQDVRIPVGRGFAGRVISDGAPRTLDRVDRTTVVNPVPWETGIQSLLGVPMFASGTAIGVLHVGTRQPRTFSEEDVRLLQLVADRIALATQARLNRADRAAAAALQRSLLPTELPAIDGLELAARYVAGTGGVGGDWYDVFGLPSGDLGIVVGDVVGRGLRAAVVMGRFRSALRAYALEFDDPSVVLGKLDRKVQHFETEIMATVVYAIVDPTHERIRLSSAGHPPPVLAVPGERPAFLDLSGDLPLGVRAGAARTTAEVAFEPDALLCLYTDGLVESHARPVSDGLVMLRDALVAGPAESVCTTLFSKLVDVGSSNDDIALMVIRRPGGD